MKEPIQMNLQLFAEGGEQPLDGAGTAPVALGGDVPPVLEVTEKTYDQTELDRIADERAERAQRAAIKGWAQQQGMTPEQVQAVLADHKARKEAEMSDLQKAQSAVADEAAKVAAKESEIATLRGKMEAISLGVKPEAADDVYALAMLREGAHDDIKGALAAVVAQYPHFKASAPAPLSDSVPGDASGGAQSKKFSEMTYAERLALKSDNPTLYEKMLKGEKKT